MAFEASVGVRDEGDQLICPPALDFESYTDIVERVTKILSKRPRTGTVVLRLTPRNVASGPLPAPRTPEALLNWEKALGLLQQTSQLVVAFVDGPIDDLSLSLALACDVRVGAPGASFTPVLGGVPSALVPTWWLASLAYHTGALRASQLLKRTASLYSTASPAGTAASSGDLGSAEALVRCGLFLAVVPADELPRFLATAVVPEHRDGAPRDKSLLLLRRILLQSFSLQNSDGIGHALAANSLLIAEALERLASSSAAPPPPMQPLGFSISEGGGGGEGGGDGGGAGGVWEVSLTSELHRVSIEELLSAVGGLSKRLEARVNEGKPLPSHLLLRLRVAPSESSEPTTTATTSESTPPLAPPPPMPPPPAAPPVPLQLMHEERQPPTDDRILRWLTRWEKVLAAVSTLPLPTVAHLVCEGDGGSGGAACGVASLAALQLAFACDLRVASARVRLGFCCASGLLPGTLTFRLAKHVGAGRAMELLALPGSVSAARACELGAVQLVAEEVPPSFLASPTAHGPKLMLCRSLLDATWHSSAATIAARLAQYEATAGRLASSSASSSSSSAPTAAAAASVVASAAAAVAAQRDGASGTVSNPVRDPVSNPARGPARDRALEMSELLSSFLPDQFIMPTDSWVWRLNFSAPNGAAAITGNAAGTGNGTGTGTSTPDAASPMRLRRSTGEEIEQGAAVGLKVEEKEGVLVATFAAARLASPALVEFVAVMRALGAQLAHGARALLLVMPGGADALRMPRRAPPELRQLWASALDELDSLPFPSCALLGGGALSEASLELALACRTRLALSTAAGSAGDDQDGTPPLSFGLGGWRASDAPLPSARLWQLVRSAGVGTMAHHLMGSVAGGCDELMRWGVLNGIVASQEDAARSLLRTATMVSAALPPTPQTSPRPCLRPCLRPRLRPDSPHRSRPTASESAEAGATAAAAAAAVATASLSSARRSRLRAAATVAAA